MKHKKILESQHNGLFKGLIEDYRDRVKIFGTHFATLDIRQDSRIHQKVIDEIVEKYTDKDVSSLKILKKVEILMTGNITANPDDLKMKLHTEKPEKCN